MSFSDALSLISSILGLVLGVLAIWLSLHFKAEADRVNQDTQNLLIDVKTDAKALTQVAQSAMSELQEYGKASRALILGRVPEMQMEATYIPEERSIVYRTNEQQPATREEVSPSETAERGEEQ